MKGQGDVMRTITVHTMEVNGFGAKSTVSMDGVNLFSYFKSFKTAEIKILDSILMTLKGSKPEKEIEVADSGNFEVEIDHSAPIRMLNEKVKYTLYVNPLTARGRVHREELN